VITEIEGRNLEFKLFHSESKVSDQIIFNGLHSELRVGFMNRIIQCSARLKCSAERAFEMFTVNEHVGR
jgi:hypothetical protein